MAPFVARHEPPCALFALHVGCEQLGLDCSLEIPIQVPEKAVLHKVVAAALSDLTAAVAAGTALDYGRTSDVRLQLMQDSQRERRAPRIRQVPVYMLCQSCKGKFLSDDVSRDEATQTCRLLEQSNTCSRENSRSLDYVGHGDSKDSFVQGSTSTAARESSPADALSNRESNRILPPVSKGVKHGQARPGTEEFGYTASTSSSTTAGTGPTRSASEDAVRQEACTSERQGASHNRESHGASSPHSTLRPLSCRVGATFPSGQEEGHDQASMSCSTIEHTDLPKDPINHTLEMVSSEKAGATETEGEFCSRHLSEAPNFGEHFEDEADVSNCIASPSKRSRRRSGCDSQSLPAIGRDVHVGQHTSCRPSLLTAASEIMAGSESTPFGECTLRIGGTPCGSPTITAARRRPAHDALLPVEALGMDELLRASSPLSNAGAKPRLSHSLDSSMFQRAARGAASSTGSGSIRRANSKDFVATAPCSSGRRESTAWSRSSQDLSSGEVTGPNSRAGHRAAELVQVAVQNFSPGFPEMRPPSVWKKRTSSPQILSVQTTDQQRPSTTPSCEGLDHKRSSLPTGCTGAVLPRLPVRSHSPLARTSSHSTVHATSAHTTSSHSASSHNADYDPLRGMSIDRWLDSKVLRER